MYVSNTAVALTITKKEAPFTDKASMLRWVDACLNCNTNNASVVVEPLNIKLAELASLQRIDASFDAVNTLLDGSGALESEPLQRAVYRLRLDIARASGDNRRILAAEASLQELFPVLQGLDLSTFEGWVAAATALLADKPSGTALDDNYFGGYMLLVGDTLYAFMSHAVVDGCVATECGIPVDGFEPDLSIWSNEGSCWEAHDPVMSRDVLLNPKFVQLKLIEGDAQ